MAHGDEKPPRCTKTVFALVTLSFAVFSIYSNSYDCSWHLDDFHSITDNPRLHLRSLSWEGLKNTFFSAPNSPDTLYRPVSCLSFALNYYLGGLDVQGYHLVNIFIHLISSFFLFLFIDHMLRLPALHGRYEETASSIALLSALLWAVNPIQTQAVTYIVQRMASIAGMFTIMSMVFYSKARTSDKRESRSLLFGLSLICFMLALGSKEIGILLPLNLLLYELLLLQEDGMRWVRKNVKILFGAVALIIGFWIAYAQYRGKGFFPFMASYQERPFSLAERLLTEARVLYFYASLLVYPMPSRLSIAHSIPLSTSLVSPVTTLLAVLATAGSVILLILIRKRHPVISFSFLFFFLNHIVESSVLPLELVFEHRNYVPSMFFFLPFVLGTQHLLKVYAARRSMKLFMAGFVIILLIGFAHATTLRNTVWRNGKSLWSDAIKKAPDQFRPYHNLGLYYQKQGDLERAIPPFEKALASPVIHRKDEKIVGYYQLAKAHEDLGNLSEAKGLLEKALQLKPDFGEAFMELASIHSSEGEDAAADQFLISAVKAKPDDPYIRFNMGIYCLRERQPDMAIENFEKSLRNEELRKSAQLYLGIAYKQKGWFGRSVLCFKEATRVKPKDITPYLHLVEVYSMKGHEGLSQEMADRVVSFMMDEESLFNQMLTTILGKGHLGHVALSPKHVLPPIYKSCERRSEDLSRWKAQLQNWLDGPQGME